ncbi:MAG TPA: DUF3102 domain-containing protein [Pseudolabrys sp.]|nr:DUF3102 domain-containing protein [Pseudolabrys sp.]
MSTLRDRELTDLAQRIAVEHDAVAAALQSALQHAIATGELLIEAKAKVRHGQWLKWLAANCEVPKRTAAHYMALARDRQKLCDQNGNVLPLSVNDALDLLKHAADRGFPGSEWGDYEPFRGWGVRGWGKFSEALQIVMRLPQLNPPAARYVVQAARAGKLPGLTAAVLREAATLLNRYADAIERDNHLLERRDLDDEEPAR